MLKKATYITGFTLFAILLIWHIWQTVYTDIPRGGSVRIAGQLIVLCVLLSGSLWIFLSDRYRLVGSISSDHQKEYQIFAWLILIVTFVQIFWGGITSGLHGGHVYNTFPKMNKNWIPPELFIMDPLWQNFIDNAATAQWMHRFFGTILGVIILLSWVRSFVTNTSFTTKKWLLAIFALFLLQYALGVYSLIFHVPPFMGLSHLLLSFVFITLSTCFLHHTYK